MKYSTYIIRCEKEYLYTGISACLSKRIREHNDGKSHITKNRRPCSLLYSRDFLTRQEAARHEKEIKGWRREKKILLIKNSLHRIM